MVRVTEALGVSLVITLLSDDSVTTNPRQQYITLMDYHINKLLCLIASDGYHNL